MGVRLLRRDPASAAAAGCSPSSAGSTARRSPPTGGCVVVGNHVSHVDPLTFAHFVYDHGRLPRFLAKAEVFDVPVVGAHLRRHRPDPGLPDDHRRLAGVPRRRGGGRGGQVRRRLPGGHAHPAARALADGRQDRCGPHRARLRRPGDPDRAVGAAGHPVAVRQQAAAVPAQDRSPLKAGDPVDLDDLRGRPLTPEVLREATDRIMDAITAPARGHPRRAGARRSASTHGGRGHARSATRTAHEKRRRHEPEQERR